MPEDDLFDQTAEETESPSAEAEPVDVPVGPAPRRRREQVERQVVAADSRIEQLRVRQRQLEQERDFLDALRKKQDTYESQKHWIMGELERGLVLLEKEEARVTRLLEALTQTRALFRDILYELRKINESSWADEDYGAELDRAYALVDNAKTDYRKAVGRIEALNWHMDSAGGPASDTLDRAVQSLDRQRSFGEWMKIGVALSLPLAVVLAVLFLLYVVVIYRPWSI